MGYRLSRDVKPYETDAKAPSYRCRADDPQSSGQNHRSGSSLTRLSACTSVGRNPADNLCYNRKRHIIAACSIKRYSVAKNEKGNGHSQSEA